MHCFLGSCIEICPDGKKLCQGPWAEECVDTQDDLDNCGDCGRARIRALQRRHMYKAV